MIAGELYFSADPELEADRAFAREQMAVINQETNNDIREQLLKETFGHVENHIYMEPNVRFDYGYNISVGKNFYANFDVTLLDVCPITFGDNCMVAPNVQLYTASHPLQPAKRNSGLENGQPITIGDNVWLGGGAIILPGVTLGDNVVVGAGSVVTKSFPANVVIAGNPATIIQELASDDAQPLSAKRKQIDAIDQKLVHLLEERMMVVTAISEEKRQQKIAVLDSNRENEVLQAVRREVKQSDFEEAIVDTFRDVMKHSRTFQSQQMEDK
ncbi:chorismate mutase [Enterococcus italicus]|nr:chorismate mutase [Enterococcus italicus]MCM6881582.1 chorismate mutase [Enterococcus italicus]MCM6931935.1 chorismate mutase [Enterococcus italicus]OJG59029.1 maltose O-acetyltransferase [Enterococcus italicus DSM 15952]